MPVLSGKLLNTNKIKYNFIDTLLKTVDIILNMNCSDVKASESESLYDGDKSPFTPQLGESLHLLSLT